MKKYFLIFTFLLCFKSSFALTQAEEAKEINLCLALLETIKNCKNPKVTAAFIRKIIRPYLSNQLTETSSLQNEEDSKKTIAEKIRLIFMELIDPFNEREKGVETSARGMLDYLNGFEE